MNVASSSTASPHWIDFSALYQRAEAISEAYQSRNLVFFLGSGASKAYCASMPNWNQLLDGLLSELKFDGNNHREEILELIKKQKYLLAAEAIKHYAICDTDNKDLAVDLAVAKVLEKRLSRVEHDPTLHLAILDFAAPIFTTNYDTILENLITEHKVTSFRQTMFSYDDVDDAAMLLSPSRKRENYVFKLHGSIHKAQRLILDEKDYSDFYFQAKWPSSLQLLRHILATKMVIFIGFSLSDPEIMLILREATRYSSSYQHLALMYGPELTIIEKEVMRTNYRVDPIVYDNHQDLPLFVMEMRNFYHREDIPLQLKPEKSKLLAALAKIKNKENIGNSTIIVFGSFAKYGYLSTQNADVDVLFLTQSSTFRTDVKETHADAYIGRKIDVTAITYQEFEKLLKNGDSFASSILVTGCPMEDPEERYSILSRGFRANLKYQNVLDNALDRYRMRWLRLCIYRNSGLSEYIQVCYQWTITTMQLFIIRDYYPIDSLLSISLLGNSRFTIREFASRFNSVDENYYLTLLRFVKKDIPTDNFPRPNIFDMVCRLVNALNYRCNKKDFDVFLPGKFLMGTTTKDILTIYADLDYVLDAFARGQTYLYFGYGGSSETEKTFLDLISKIQKLTGNNISMLDSLFFFLLYDEIKKEAGNLSLKDEKSIAICDQMRKKWESETSVLRNFC